MTEKGADMVLGKQRIIGTEVEWIIIGSRIAEGADLGRPGEILSLPGRSRTLFSLFPEELAPRQLAFITDRIWLLNGALVYMDTGFHLEYASPEGLGPQRAYVYERAGEEGVEDLIARANREMP